MSIPPLKGIRVIDLTQYTPGPYATRLLCDLGAEVIKIEPPQGDPLRNLFKSRNSKTSPVYQHLNRGKRIARIDLKSSAVIESLTPLLKAADVLIESFRPEVLQRLGLGWETLKQTNPSLIYCSLSGYGQEGPNKYRAGHDINYNAAAGLFSYSQQPATILPLIADHSGGMNAVTAILAALVSRGTQGTGTYIDVSLYETILSWQYLAHSTMADAGNRELQLLGGGAACYNIYATSDSRHVTLGALETKFWENFCREVNTLGWISRQFEPLPQADLINEVADLFGQHPLKYWINRFGNIDCCFEPIPKVSEIYQHPQSLQRGLYGLNEYNYPGKFNQQACHNSAEMEEHEINQIPTWRNLTK